MWTDLILLISPAAAGTNTALYFQYISSQLLSKTSSKLKKEVIYYIRQRKSSTATGYPHRFSSLLPTSSSRLYYSNLEVTSYDLMMQQNQMDLSFLWNVFSLLLYVQHNLLFSDSHWCFDSVDIIKTSICRKPNEFTEQLEYSFWGQICHL